MALRSGYYGLKKKLLNKVIGLPGIKTIGTGLSLSSAGVLSATGSGGGIDYSTTEQDTGTKWTDGKSIYCKTFIGDLSSLVNSVTHNISNLADLIKIEGVGVITGTSGNNVFTPLDRLVMTGTGTALNISYMFALTTVDSSAFEIRLGSDLLDTALYSKVGYKLTLYYTKTS